MAAQSAHAQGARGGYGQGHGGASAPLVPFVQSGLPDRRHAPGYGPPPGGWVQHPYAPPPAVAPISADSVPPHPGTVLGGASGPRVIPGGGGGGGGGVGGGGGGPPPLLEAFVTPLVRPAAAQGGAGVPQGGAPRQDDA